MKRNHLKKNYTKQMILLTSFSNYDAKSIKEKIKLFKEEVLRKCVRI
jgi:hypothetical protein